MIRNAYYRLLKATIFDKPPGGLTSVTDAAAHVTSYAYDTENNLLSITDAAGHTTSFSYDAFGRVTQTTFPSTLTESYVYSAVGTLTSKTDRKGQTIQYFYDALDRLTSKTYPDSTSVAYTYDDASRLTQVQDATGTYSFLFDNMGRLKQTTTAYSFVTGNPFTIVYGYDAASNRTGMTDPNNGHITYTYDTLNRLSNINDFNNNSFGFSYDALSRRTQLTRPNGINTNYGYDALSNLLSVLHQAGVNTLDGATYTYDLAGNRTSKTNLLNSTTSNYTYDNIYQLTGVTGPNPESYTYDPVGNRLTSQTIPSYTYNSSNEMTAAGSATYTYDDNGNTLTKTDGSGTTTYSWDFENRLTSAQLPNSSTVAFKYDPFGRRIQKGTSVYVYEKANLIQETDTSENVIARYVFGSGVDESLTAYRGGSSEFYQADGLGSVISLSSLAGVLTDSFSYDSFGNLNSFTGSFTQPFRYTGREADAETGLYYYRARYYDPAVGRFISEDPLGVAAGSNFYSYVANGPTNWVDHFSLFKEKQKEPCPVDTGKLAHCIFDLYGLVLLNFTPTIGNGTSGGHLNPPNVDGTATLLIPAMIPTGLTITNDIHSKAWNDVPKQSYIYDNPNVANTASSSVTGWTDPRNPYTNYTVNSTVGQAAINTQIWELGNSLSDILGMTPSHLHDWRNDPGGVLLGCYLRAIGRAKDIDWE
jgi:RHS repeat-associated protein